MQRVLAPLCAAGLTGCVVVITPDEVQHDEVVHGPGPRVSVGAVPPAERLEPLSAADLAPHPGRQTYVAHRTATPIVVDGVVDEAAWLAAPETGHRRPPPPWWRPPLRWTPGIHLGWMPRAASANAQARSSPVICVA